MKKVQLKDRRRQGFTLIELLLVMVILAILAAVVLPKLTGRREQANVAAAKTQLDTFKTALNMFEIDNGRYPTNEEGLNALVVQPAGMPNWKGYLEKKEVPVDPWGNPYKYTSPGQNNTTTYDLWADGKQDDPNNVNNWK